MDEIQERVEVVIAYVEYRSPRMELHSVRIVVLFLLAGGSIKDSDFHVLLEALEVCDVRVRVVAKRVTYDVE